MASRDRKISLGNKKTPGSPASSKESPDMTKTENSNDDKKPKVANKPAALGQKLKKKSAKPPITKINLKAKNKCRKITKIKVLKKAVKANPEIKKNLLNNGVKKSAKKLIPKPKIKVEPLSENEEEDNKEEVVVEKPVRKVVAKKTGVKAGSKVEGAGSPKTKRKYVKKIKVETVDDVMNDLNMLLKEEDIKKEVDTLSTTSSPPPQPAKQRITKKAANKVLVNKSKVQLQQENIENSLSKINTEETKNVIDVLDLNVKINKPSPVPNMRRHSIEKFPLDSVEVAPTFFSTLPRRSLSPRAKRNSKTRLSIDSKRSSPYTTRSDTPNRILRNGKARKLKSGTLLDGLDSNELKKRKRLCSEYSGSEVSKNSGYESDSSFSDLASLHGTENVENPPEDNKCLENDLENSTNKPINTSSLKDAATTTQTQLNGGVDTNSNVCPTNILLTPKSSDSEDKSLQSNEFVDVSPSVKVPEKSLILDSMKLIFNADESAKKKLPDTIVASSFYGTKDIEKEKEVSDSLPANEVSTQDEIKQENDDTLGEEVDNISMEIVDTSQELEKTHECENEVKTKLENGENHIEEPAKIEDEVLLNEKNGIEEKTEEKMEIDEVAGKVLIEETPEERAIKEDMLNALGLQSLKAAEEARLKKSKAPKNDPYTGTLKTVIKLKEVKKKGRPSTKITLQKKKTAKESSQQEAADNKTEEDNYKVPKEGASSANWKFGKDSSESAGAARKSHYSNRSNMDASSEHTSDGDTGPAEEGELLLVIPEKASSFSIHPGRLCKDECTYCFGKFGLFDTPCHIATIKSVDRQNRILAAEKHLQRDSCLCDACFRHVDRKSNAPSYTNKSVKRNSLVAPTPKEDHCHVLNCGQIATTILRRKWIIKMRKSICKVINIDIDNPGLHSIPVCDTHIQALEHLMVCGMCKRKLARNHIHYLGAEVSDLNIVLNKLGVPVTLKDRPLVCKWCKFFSTVALKDTGDIDDSSMNFFDEYKKRLLHYHGVELMDPEKVEEPLPMPVLKEKMEKDQLKKRKRGSRQAADESAEVQDQEAKENVEKRSKSVQPESRPESPSDYMVDYNTLIPKIAMDCTESSDSESNKKTPKMNSIILKKIPKPETVKEAVEISKNINKLKQRSDIAVQRLGSNPSISVRQLFPGEEELPLQGHIDFINPKERTPEGWEKCNATIQYDMDTKLLWQELQKPYGNQSSFLRHLILLEKYFRNGDLILSPNASHHSVNYSESVQNRLRAYDNIPSNITQSNPLPNMAPIVSKKVSGIVANKETTVTVMNTANIPKSVPPISIGLATGSSSNQQPKKGSIPPGLMPLMPGSTRPIAPLVKVPQSQKIKFPITKNWRPNLIPIEPNKKIEKKQGLVQVISGGKPYHITVEDYKKMCAIKRTFDLRQKRLQEQKTGLQQTVNANSVLKPRKGVYISKTSTIISPKNPDDEIPQDILEKLDKSVIENHRENEPLILPKIPKSLTVIPQSVPKKTSRPSSPVNKNQSQTKS